MKYNTTQYLKLQKDKYEYRQKIKEVFTIKGGKENEIQNKTKTIKRN